MKIGKRLKIKKIEKLDGLKILHQIKNFYKRIEIGKNGRLDQIENNFKIFLK